MICTYKLKKRQPIRDSTNQCLGLIMYSYMSVLICCCTLFKMLLLWLIVSTKLHCCPLFSATCLQRHRHICISLNTRSSGLWVDTNSVKPHRSLFYVECCRAQTENLFAAPTAPCDTSCSIASFIYFFPIQFLCINACSILMQDRTWLIFAAEHHFKCL